VIDFLLVGTFKAGSSSIAYGLAESNDVFIPAVKDPYYFLKNRLEAFVHPEKFVAFQHKFQVTSSKAFQALFEKNFKALQGEATPLYLYVHEYAIPEIKKLNQNAKIIIVLRNPIERAFSNYTHNKKDGFEDRSFKYVTRNYRSLEVESTHPFFHYVSAGFYARQVQAFLENFDDVLVIKYEDFKFDQGGVINQILSFLGARGVSRTSGLRLNKTGRVRNMWLHQFIHHEGVLKRALRPLFRFIFRNPRHRLKFTEFVKNKNLASESVDAESRAWLQNLYEDDVNQLSALLKFDFQQFWFK
jgi:hypothetical protein